MELKKIKQDILKLLQPLSASLVLSFRPQVSKVWFVGIAMWAMLLWIDAFAQYGNAPLPLPKGYYFKNDTIRPGDGYTGVFFLTGGPILALGSGESAFENPASGTIGDFEFGILSKKIGSGFIFEMRTLEWAWLSNSSETRVRLGMVSVGLRYHFFTLFRRYTEILPLAISIGYNRFRLSEPMKWERRTEYLGSGIFTRADILSWTYIGNADEDPKTPYDPYIEAGIFLSLGSSVEWLGGIEVSVGGAVSKITGSMLFIRTEAQLFGHRGRGLGPFSKLYGRKI